MPLTSRCLQVNRSNRPGNVPAKIQVITSVRLCRNRHGAFDKVWCNVSIGILDLNTTDLSAGEDQATIFVVVSLKHNWNAQLPEAVA